MNTYTEIAADAAEIVKFYTGDFLTKKQISGLYECSPEEIADILRSQGIQLRPKGFIPDKRHPAHNHADEIAMLHEEGYLSVAKIAEIYKCSTPVVYWILKAEVVELCKKRII